MGKKIKFKKYVLFSYIKRLSRCGRILCHNNEISLLNRGEHFLLEHLLTALQRLLQEKVVATGLHMD